MDVLRNFKSMTVGQFCTLQIFEFAYLMVLAFLPFVLAFREITYTILIVLGVVVIVAVYRNLVSRFVDPTGKVILVTGCDSGFGNACARQLSSHGFTVVAGCYDTDSEGARGLRDTKNVHIIKLDITNEDNVKQSIQKINNLCHDKGLWALVNNAGVSTFGSVEFVSLDTYKDTVNVNILGTLRITKAFLPFIRTAKGRVVMVTGSTGKLSLPGQSTLCLSNFSLEALSDALRIELQPFGVKVITVRPGNFAGATGMLNKTKLEKLRLQFDEVNVKGDRELLKTYGSNYLDNQYNQLLDLSRSSANSLVNVVEAIGNAVRSQNPKSQVLVDGGNQLIDLGNILIHLRPFLPCWLHDLLVSKFYGTKIDSADIQG